MTPPKQLMEAAEKAAKEYCCEPASKEFWGEFNRLQHQNGPDRNLEVSRMLERYGFKRGVEWLFNHLSELSEPFDTKEQADEILKLYAEPSEMIDSGNLFFAATEYRNAYNIQMAALLKAREYCDDLEESAGRLAIELGAPPDGWRIKGPRLVAELEVANSRLKDLEAALETYLDNEFCRETSCPFPMRAMCNNPMHQLVRKALKGNGDEG